MFRATRAAVRGKKCVPKPLWGDSLVLPSWILGEGQLPRCRDKLEKEENGTTKAGSPAQCWAFHAPSFPSFVDELWDLLIEILAEMRSRVPVT